MPATLSPRIRRISNKKRLDTALRGGQPDAVPFFELNVAGHVAAAVLGRPSSPSITELPAKDYLEVVQRIGMDFLMTSYVSQFGRSYQRASDGSSQYVDGCIKSMELLNSARLPSADAVFRRLDSLCEAVRSSEAGIIFGLDSPYKAVKMAVGPQDFLIKTIDDPEFLVHFRDVMAEHLGVILRRALEYPLAAVVVAGDLCSGAGPMASPSFLRSYWVENMRRFLQPAREKDVPVILHMDGDFTSVTDMMLETGVSAIHPFEVTGGLSIYEMKRRLQGRIAVAGNIDCAGVLMRGTPRQVREDVRLHIERLAPGGGYACGSSHDIGDSIPLENFWALARAIDDLGNYS